MDHLPWVEKYRPKALGEIKGHGDIITVLKKFGGVSAMPHLLFYGPPGTGKTSTILAMAKDFYGTNLKSMSMEVNASDERGIEIVTGKIKSFVQSHSLVGPGVKLVILDEADALTVDAQSALRRIIEKSTKDVRFCLCCNFSSKISEPLQSRCTKFRFPGIDRDSLREKALEISSAEGITFSESTVDTIIDLANGDARRVINLMHSAFLSSDGKPISPDFMYKIAGSPLPSDTSSIVTSLTSDSFQESFQMISQLVKNKGYAVSDVVTELSRRILSMFEGDPSRMSIVLNEFSNIEYNLAEGGSETLAVGHLVSCFHIA